MSAGRHFRALAALLPLIVVPRLAGQSCPTRAPSSAYLGVSGANCSTYSTPCSLNQPVTFSINSYPVQACDTISWTFGDGGTATTTGVVSTTHTYTTAGYYQAYANITNSLGSALATASSYYAANGFIGFYWYVSTSAIENDGTATVNVIRTSSSGATSGNYATSDTGGYAGSRYTATSGTLSFAAGEVSKAISIPLINNSVFEGDATFTVTVSSPTGGYVIPTDNNTNYRATTQVVIRDDDPAPTFRYDAASYRTSEGSGNLKIIVNRTGDMTRTVTANYYTSMNNNPFSPYYGTVTFLPNVAQTTITLNLVNDDVYQGQRTGYFELNSPSGGAVLGNGSYYYDVNVIIDDDETKPDLILDDVNIVEGNSGTKNAVFNGHLTSKVSDSIYYSWQTADGTARAGSDYVASNGYYTYLQSRTTSFTITVPVLGDTIVEPDETFTVSVTFPYGSGLINALKTTATCRILNDDSTIAPATLTVAKGATGFILVDIGQPTSPPAVLTVTSSDPNVAKVPANITFLPGISRAEVPVNAVAAGSATVSVNLPPSLGGLNLTSLVSVYEGANLVFDPKSVSVPVGGTSTVQVSAQPALPAPLFVTLSTLDSSVIEVPPSVIIQPGQPATFTVKGLKAGVTSLRAQLPPQNGAATLFIPAEVAEAPVTPSITRVQPPSGPIAGGTIVTVDGSKLTADCTLTFGGAPATFVAPASASSMTAVTPPHTAGVVDVVLTCPAGSATLNNAFTYVSSSATISGVTPSFGSADGGTWVRVVGSNFVGGCWPFFDGNAARNATMRSASEIVSTSPAHAAGTVDVSLRCGSATAATLANAFTFSAGAEPSPVITSLDPLAGSAGQSITVSGARFAAGDRVTFDAAEATILSYAPDALVVQIPTLPLGKVSVTVTDSAGHSSTTGPIFTVTETSAPQINSATPNSVLPGSEVVLDGSGFRPGYSFAIGIARATTLSMTYKRAVIRVPEMPPGNYAVNVFNAAGQVATVGPPVTVGSRGVTVASMVPGCMTSDGGISVTIRGSGFESGATAALDGVTLGNVTVVDGTTITARVPATAPGSPTLAVTNVNGDRGTLTGGVTIVSPLDPTGICGARKRPVHH